MKALKMISSILLVVGGLNWGLFGMLNMDLVATLFGAGSTLAKAVYVLVGLAALYKALCFLKGGACSSDSNKSGCCGE